MPYIHQIPDAPIAPSMLPSLCLKNSRLLYPPSQGFLGAHRALCGPGRHNAHGPKSWANLAF